MRAGPAFLTLLRRKVQIIDREGLIDFADGSYGIPAARMRRLVEPAHSN
jgi:hypothetical protein